MNLNERIEATLQFDLSKEKQTILSLLSKHFNLVIELSEGSDLPLSYPYLYINESQFRLISQLQEASPTEYIFTKIKDILVLIRHYIKTKQPIYVCIKNEQRYTYEEVWSGIHASLHENDPESFLYYTNQLSQDFQNSPRIK